MTQYLSAPLRHNNLNKKCGRRVRPTWYAPAGLKNSILFPELRRGRDETYRRCELMTLTFNLGGHGACRWCGSTSSILTPTLKFIGLTVRKIWHILCVCVSWPVTLTFDLETSVRVASKAENLPSKFGHARPFGSRIIRYVCDGRTDRHTKATLLTPSVRAGTN